MTTDQWIQSLATKIARLEAELKELREQHDNHYHMTISRSGGFNSDTPRYQRVWDD